MRPHLGSALWDDFVAHANTHHKAAWLRAFVPSAGVLRCVGTLDGAPCPHAATVDLRRDGDGDGDGNGDASEALERLHLDHERPLHLTCGRWREQLPPVPSAWDDKLVDGAALCHDLFGVCASATHGAARVRFRCGPQRDASGARMRFAEHAYCHRA